MNDSVFPIGQPVAVKRFANPTGWRVSKHVVNRTDVPVCRDTLVLYELRHLDGGETYAKPSEIVRAG